MNSSSSAASESVVESLVLGGLLSARWWLPVESASLGETLPLVQITLLFAVFVAWR